MASNKTHAGKNTLLKVVILGDGRVGKSCLMTRFVRNQFDDHSLSTIGVEFLTKEIKIRNDVYTLQIWDTAGQERFKSLRIPFYRGSDICMLTFSVDDRTSFQNLAMWKNEFLYYADIKESSLFPFVVVGNKIDIGEDQREVTNEEAADWCRENGSLPYVETSAKDTINVDMAFDLAVEIWSKLEEMMDNRALYEDSTISLKDIPGESESTCC